MPIRSTLCTCRPVSIAVDGTTSCNAGGEVRGYHDVFSHGGLKIRYAVIPDNSATAPPGLFNICFRGQCDAV